MGMRRDSGRRAALPPRIDESGPNARELTPNVPPFA